MACGNCADVDLDRRRELLAGYRLYWLPEEIRVRQLECFKRNARIGMPQPLAPFFFSRSSGSISASNDFIPALALFGIPAVRPPVFRPFAMI
jgi:hypothetical protein